MGSSLETAAWLQDIQERIAYRGPFRAVTTAVHITHCLPLLWSYGDLCREGAVCVGCEATEVQLESPVEHTPVWVDREHLYRPQEYGERQGQSHEHLR